MLEIITNDNGFILKRDNAKFELNATVFLDLRNFCENMTYQNEIIRYFECMTDDKCQTRFGQTSAEIINDKQLMTGIIDFLDDDRNYANEPNDVYSAILSACQ